MAAIDNLEKGKLQIIFDRSYQKALQGWQNITEKSGKNKKQKNCRIDFEIKIIIR